MEVQIEPRILDLVSAVENDFSKAVSEALNLCPRERIIVCPITKSFCTNHRGSCNECSVTNGR